MVVFGLSRFSVFSYDIKSYLLIFGCVVKKLVTGPEYLAWEKRAVPKLRGVPALLFKHLLVSIFLYGKIDLDSDRKMTNKCDI